MAQNLDRSKPSTLTQTTSFRRPETIPMEGNGSKKRKASLIMSREEKDLPVAEYKDQVMSENQRIKSIPGVANSRLRLTIEPSWDDIESWSSITESDGPIRTPETDQDESSEKERLMQTLWAQVLQINPDDVERYDDFFNLGGNATTALRLSRIASGNGLFFSVRDVFQNSQLHTLSALACDSITPPAIPPFSLLGSSIKCEEIHAQAAQLCHVQESHVVDIFPCTPLQEGMLALTQTQPGSYVEQHVFEIDSKVSIKKLCRAWDFVVATNPIMRTRIISLPNHGIMQVVLEEGVKWIFDTDLEKYQHQRDEDAHHMSLGTPLMRFAIIDGDTGGRRYFIWELHHALYDGWSMSLLIKEAMHAYYNDVGQALESMACFVKFVQDRDETASKSFWRAQLADTKGLHFPLSKAAVSRSSQSDAQMNFNVSGLGWGHSDFTPATIVKAAWAVVVACRVKSDEAIYGMTVAGRQAEVPGIERIAGPTIATVPIRVSLNWDHRVNQLLDSVQRQSIDMIPFEQTGLQRIRRMGEAAATACDFGSLLVVQPASVNQRPSDRPFLSEPRDGDCRTQQRDLGTYAIEVECHLGTDDALVNIAFDSSVVPQREMERIARNFEHVLRQVADQAQGQETLASLVASSQATIAGINDILTWNARVPEPVEECLHTLIGQRVREHPDAPAIQAWDGDLTYQQLDELSTKLARHLVGRGVAGTLVPVLFEKSLWMPVAVLAVMKAGGALVALEIKQPEERLRAIVSQTNPSVLLSSEQNVTLARRLVKQGVVIVGRSHHPGSASQTDYDSDLPVVTPASLLYVIFTSGSTGTPKGVLISHRNLCSAIAHQRDALSYRRHSRVFDFASCAFDVGWSNLFNTLTAGACLCIPSTSERENDLAGCLVKYNVTLMDLTPSLARAIGPDALSGLETVILGGEAALPSDASSVSDKTHIINAYGPAECTPTALLATLDPASVCIGRGAGACTWVVEADGPALLAPIGAVGELWLEGPIVGEGYLNDPEKTAAAFIEDPAWLLRATGRRGRVYRTGDLVRYNKDGTLVFVGRKDTQVKLRGQRVELGEVESCIGRFIKSANVQVVAEAIQPTGVNNPILVAFITLHNAGITTEDAHSIAVRSVTDRLGDSLREAVPSYMIPAAYLPIQRLPATATGKTDRRQLRDIGASMWLQYRSSCEKKNASIQPLNETEKIVQSAWMSVLNLSAEEASIDATFASLGGDSISAMQLVSQCRLHNLFFTVRDIFETKTIRKLSACCQPASCGRNKLLEDAEKQESEDADGVFDLTPIQDWFFDTYPDGLNHYNQSFLLHLSSKVSPATLNRAIQALVGRHAMLRARFGKDSDSGRWRQMIVEDNAESFVFAEHSLAHPDEVNEAAQWRQENLDIRNGPVFACDLFNLADGGQVVLLSAHHLVIDLVSWRLVWNDVEEYIKFGELRSQKTLSFRTWSALQASMGRNLSPLTVLPYPIPEPQVGFWGSSVEDTAFGQCDVTEVSFSTEVTKLLFGKCNDSLRTEGLDLILGAMFHSFLHTFPSRPLPAIWLEGHGREQLDDIQVDVSGTVGWFTTLHPLAVSIGLDDPITNVIRLVKDMRRKVPGKGLPFYACRYLSESGREAFQAYDVYEIVLNFTGRFQQLEREDGLLKSSQGMTDADFKICEISQSARRGFIIEIEASVADGQLGISFTCPKGIRHRDQINQWIHSFSEDVKSIALGLADAPIHFTLSDLPLLPLSYRGLDVLLQEQLPKLGIQSDAILDIYPCTPLQDGMLLSSAKGAASYATLTIWRCKSADGDTAGVSPSQLETAWKKVASRHTILSSIFALHPDGNGFVQIVLDRPPIRVTHIAAGRDDPTKVLSRLEQPVFAANEPEHALTICQSQTGEVACRLDMSHTLNDAHSTNILLQEFAAVYEDVVLPTAPAFADMIRFINSTPRSQTLASWTSLLDGLKPCEFPISPLASRQGIQATFGEVSHPTNFKVSITDFCRKAEIMPSAFLQVAWAMVLSHFTGMHEVCFGYLVSGRDAMVDKVDALVGPLANLLVSRVKLQAPARQVLEAISETSKRHMSIQHASLAEIQHELGLSGQRLFNTSLSIRQANNDEAERAEGLSFDILNGEDSHEYDLKFSAFISGNATEIAVEFREPYVSRQMAHEACDILNKAIEYLLATDMGVKIEGQAESSLNNCVRAHNEESLMGGFFKRVVGMEVTAASSFWKAQYTGIQGFHFPTPKRTTHQPEPKYDDVRSRIEGLDWSHGDLTADAMIRAAWSIMTARILGSDESIFGAVIPDGQASIVLPIRVVVDWESSIGRMVHDAQRQIDEMAPFQRMGLGRIRRLNDEAALGCNFQTLLVTCPPGEGKFDAEDNECFSACVLVVKVRPETTAAHVNIKFDTHVIDQSRALRIAHQFKHVLCQLLDVNRRQEKLRDVTVASQQDLDNIWTWNATVPEPIEGCIHDLIIQQANQRPQAPAINAWDGNLTYSQLHELSSKLANQLVNKGVGVGSIVPLCFEKSMWMPVAALAVMKAGAASVAIDTSLPEERIRTITTQVFAGVEKPKVLLSSVSNDTPARRLEADEVIIVGLDQLTGLIYEQTPKLPVVSPSDMLYTVFTSGSTGRPKGVMITHQNFYSAISYQRDALGINSSSRVLDFASYAFDVVWLNLLKTLTAGGCLCIPSAAEREDNLGGCLEKYKVTVVDLTPTVARIIEPKSALSNLSTLILGGEAVAPSDSDLAGEKTRVAVAYGPAECTPTSAILDFAQSREVGIGRGVGMCTWVVDVENSEALTPLGAVGELWLEGPLVGQGYLHEPEKTAAAFVQDPTWLTNGAPGGKRPGRRGWVYRTGDLVQYREDGSLIFVGRKDTQIKIRGQRVELGDIEHHARRAIETTEAGTTANVQVVAETIHPQGMADKILVVFVALESSDCSMMPSERYDEAVGEATAGVTEQLAKLLPTYMLPSIYIPIRAVPMSATGKIDRRRLHDIGSSLTAKDITTLSRAGNKGQTPQTDAERDMQALWAEVLKKTQKASARMIASLELAAIPLEPCNLSAWHVTRASR
ncbi:Nonribosomal peptide synthase atnA [Cladobotryum mycophilum]|uniref:Nonribosomal peptide synthase atnA n=1 Tax=Cladobotryum mycophilum TaxID=491253 RepID=A0ABR0T5A2_9HYPO